MKKIFIIILILFLSGCQNNNLEKKPLEEKIYDDNFYVQEEDALSDNKTFYQKNIKFICNLIDITSIKDVNNTHIIDNNGDLYEYSNKPYRDTNQNCKKIESPVKFKKFYGKYIISNDNIFYTISNNKLKKSNIQYDNIDNLIKVSSRYISSDRYLDILIEENSIYLINKIDINNLNNINDSQKKLIFTIPQGENIILAVDNLIKTNKNFYIYRENRITTNYSECNHYGDVECQYKYLSKMEKPAVINNRFDKTAFYKPYNLILDINKNMYFVNNDNA